MRRAGLKQGERAEGGVPRRRRRRRRHRPRGRRGRCGSGAEGGWHGGGRAAGHGHGGARADRSGATGFRRAVEAAAPGNAGEVNVGEVHVNTRSSRFE